MVKKALGLLTLIGMLSFATAVPVLATVLTGPITNLPESSSPYYWGDGVHDLYQEWSTRSVSGGDGYFYGSSFSWSNADVYVYHNLTDPTSVSDASGFSYSTGWVIALEGDTVFFRGSNGYYGAWRIDDIIPGDPPPIRLPYTFLYGQWYFQDNGTSNFGGSAAVPEPATMLLLGSGLIGLWGVRRKFKK